MNTTYLRATATGIVLSLLLSGCFSSESSTGDDIEELGQQVGDMMASLDEAGGSGGSISRRSDAEAHCAAMNRARAESCDPRLLTTCGQAGEFSSCSSNLIVRNFGGCNIGFATFTGTVSLTWGGGAASCTLGSTGHHITRVPNFTVTGLHNATLAVTGTGSIGQRMTWSSGSGASKVFSFSNDGIRRVFTAGSGRTLFDLTTTVTSPITFTGTDRTSRVMTGGTLRLLNNISGKYCDISPTGVTWDSASCNCARSGVWSGTCSDGTTFSLTLNSCGTAGLVVGGESSTLTFDRCVGS